MSLLEAWCCRCHLGPLELVGDIMSWELVESLALQDLRVPMELAGAGKMESWVTRSPWGGWCNSIYLEPLESASAKVRGNMGWWEPAGEPPKALGFCLVPRLASSGV